MFLALMSREMHTPLNAILGHQELLRDRGADNDTARRLGTVVNAARGLLSLIDDILDISKAESGSMVVKDIPFDLRALVGERAEMLAPLVDAKSLRFDVDVRPGVARGYRGDPARIRQILVNLLGSAIKFTSTGGVTIDVDVCAGDGRRDGRHIRHYRHRHRHRAGSHRDNLRTVSTGRSDNLAPFWRNGAGPRAVPASRRVDGARSTCRAHRSWAVRFG
nr:histidine kinase dimerization/phospho-acceptor domain-containing protein [Burkholderia ubonensis]